VIVGAIVLAVAAAAVFRWLPARAAADTPAGQPTEPLPADESAAGAPADSPQPSLASSPDQPAPAHAMSRVAVDEVTPNGHGRVDRGFDARESQSRSQ